jgi:hypothetical protein
MLLVKHYWTLLAGSTISSDKSLNTSVCVCVHMFVCVCIYVCVSSRFV